MSSPTTPEIERAAQALTDYWLEHGYDPSEPNEDAARAVLESLLDPSPRMIEAMGDVLFGKGRLVKVDGSMSKAFRAAILCALGRDEK